MFGSDFDCIGLLTFPFDAAEYSSDAGGARLGPNVHLRRLVMDGRSLCSKYRRAQTAMMLKEFARARLVEELELAKETCLTLLKHGHKRRRK
jgi:hypothetical protein